MEKNNNKNLKYCFAIILAVWFALTSMLWAYFANLILAVPAGIIAYILAESLGRQGFLRRRRLILYILGTGLLCSAASFVILMIYN